jgi:hypothetical protein
MPCGLKCNIAMNQHVMQEPCIIHGCKISNEIPDTHHSIKVLEPQRKSYRDIVSQMDDRKLVQIRNSDIKINECQEIT